MIEISKGSKVKYELDKKTGLIKVNGFVKWILLTYIVVLLMIMSGYPGWPCSVFIRCLSPQLWFHPAHSLWGQWPARCVNHYAGDFIWPSTYLRPIAAQRTKVLDRESYRIIGVFRINSCLGPHRVALLLPFSYKIHKCYFITEDIGNSLRVHWWATSMVQEPVLPGCFLRAKAIGLMPMIDQVHATLFLMRIMFYWPLYIDFTNSN